MLHIYYLVFIPVECSMRSLSSVIPDFFVLSLSLVAYYVFSCPLF